MYQNFFHLDLPPFDQNPDPRFIVLTSTHREALATLVYAMDQREGWALLYGDAGLGKTTLLQALMMELDQTTVAGVVAGPSRDILDLCNQIALALGMEGPYESKGTFFIGLRKHLKQLRAQNETILLVIDDAHSLTPEQLVELRLLATADRDEPRVLGIFLSSRPAHQTPFAAGRGGGPAPTPTPAAAAGVLDQGGNRPLCGPAPAGGGRRPGDLSPGNP